MVSVSSFLLVVVSKSKNILSNTSSSLSPSGLLFFKLPSNTPAKGLIILSLYFNDLNKSTFLYKLPVLYNSLQLDISVK